MIEFSTFDYFRQLIVVIKIDSSNNEWFSLLRIANKIRLYVLLHAHSSPLLLLSNKKIY
jgi:hypothetical protein